MPLSLIVGQDTIKSALILLAVNPAIGGIVIGKFHLLFACFMY